MVLKILLEGVYLYLILMTNILLFRDLRFEFVLFPILFYPNSFVIAYAQKLSAQE